MYVFGGGYIGQKKKEKKRVNLIKGFADAYWSIDGGNWTKINYEEGGKGSMPFYSSQEWSYTTSGTKNLYFGNWGMEVLTFNKDTGKSTQGDIYFIGGDFSDPSMRSSAVYRSNPGLFCDELGIACNGA